MVLFIFTSWTNSTIHKTPKLSKIRFVYTGTGRVWHSNHRNRPQITSFFLLPGLNLFSSKNINLYSFVFSYTSLKYKAHSRQRFLCAPTTRVLGTRVFGAVDADFCVCFDDTNARMTKERSRGRGQRGAHTTTAPPAPAPHSPQLQMFYCVLRVYLV